MAATSDQESSEIMTRAFTLDDHRGVEYEVTIRTTCSSGTTTWQVVKVTITALTRSYEPRDGDVRASRLAHNVLYGSDNWAGNPSTDSELGWLPTGLHNALRRVGITTMTKLMATTDQELLDIRNVGERAVELINAGLAIAATGLKP